MLPVITLVAMHWRIRLHLAKFDTAVAYVKLGDRDSERHKNVIVARCMAGQVNSAGL